MQSAEVRHEASCYVGGLDEKVTEAILWELFIQAGPVISVFLPKDRLTDVHQGFSFVEMQTEEDADYAIKILNMIKLFNKPIRVNKASAHQKDIDVGANIFVGNLDPSVDEKTLYDIFSAFGVILSPPRIMKDPTTDVSKGYAFINFATFESSDAAIEAMNGQFLENKPIYIQYAFKKESKGERHGSIAERLLASKNPYIGTASNQPNQFYTENPLQMPDASNSQVMVGQPIDQAQPAQFQQNMAIPVLQGQQLMMPFFNPQFLPPPPTINYFPGTAGNEVLAPPPFMPPMPMMMPQIPLPNFPMASSDLPPAPDNINMQVAPSHELPKPPMLDDSLQNTAQ